MVASAAVEDSKAVAVAVEAEVDSVVVTVMVAVTDVAVVQDHNKHEKKLYKKETRIYKQKKIN